MLGDVFLGLENGNFGQCLPGWNDHGSISAIDVATGKRVWKFETPEPERGGVTTTASGLGFAGGGDGVLRAFDTEDGQGALDVPDRPPDRGRADDLLGRRQGVHRDHGRRHADVVGRRPRVAAAGVRARRQPAAVAEAARADVGRAAAAPASRPSARRAAGEPRARARDAAAARRGATRDRTGGALALAPLESRQLEPRRRRRDG